MLLAALKGQNQGPPPVWLMRQAGRYLPEYRKIREKHSLRDLFFTPELAAAITLLPIDLIGVDAAILFSDITVVALPLGFSLDFGKESDSQQKMQLLHPSSAQSSPCACYTLFLRAALSAIAGCAASQ